MSQSVLAKVHQQLGSAKTGWLFVLAGAVAGLLVLGVVAAYLRMAKTTPQYPTAADGPKLQDLTYLEDQPTEVIFAWQPIDQPPIEIVGQLRQGDSVPNTTANPGTALVNEGYRMVEVEQTGLAAYQNQTGFQRDKEVCVVTASMSNGEADMWVDNPSYTYELSCGILP